MFDKFLVIFFSSKTYSFDFNPLNAQPFLEKSVFRLFKF